MSKKKIVLILFSITLIILLFLVIWHPKQVKQKTNDKITIPAPIPTSSIAKQLVNQVSIKEANVKPLEKSNPHFQDKTINKFPFCQDSILLFEREEKVAHQQRLKVIKIIKTKRKNPLVRVVEVFDQKPEGNTFKYSTAMVANHFIVNINKPNSFKDLSKAMEAIGARVGGKLPYSNSFYVEFDVNSPDQFEKMKDALEQRKDLLNFIPNYIVNAL